MLATLSLQFWYQLLNILPGFEASFPNQDTQYTVSETPQKKDSERCMFIV